MAGGGGKGPVTLKKGESWDAWLAPQTGCNALAVPRRYRLRGVRHLTDDSTMPEGCSPILLPDTTVQPLDDRGVAISQACVDWLTRAPAIASEFEIEIMPYDREVVRKAVERELAVDGDERMGLMASYGAWFCGHLGCELGRGDELDKWLGGALAKLPETWPTK